MVKKKTKNYVQLGILLFGILLSTLFINCENDVISENININQYKRTILNHNEVIQNEKIAEKITKFRIKKEKYSKDHGRLLHSDDFGFTIDTDRVVRIENSNGNHSYNFHIIRDSIMHNNIENLVLNLNDNNEYDTFIINYGFTHNDYENLDPSVIINSVSTITKIDFDTSIFNSDELHGKVFQTVEENDDWDCDKFWTINTSDCCEFASFEWINCGQSGGGTSGDTGNTGGGGSSSNGTGSTGSTGSGGTTQHGGLISTPATADMGLTIECNKITTLFNDYPDLLNELQTLQGQTDLLQERGLYTTEGASVIQHPAIGVNGGVEFQTLPAPYLFIAHTHNSPASNTYSVFSWGDLQGYYELITGNHIKVSSFVAFLFTADGTNYAFTFNDVGKFREFFAIQGEPFFDLTTAMNRVRLADQYYGELIEPRNQNPLIQENATNNDDDLKNFLDLIHDNDLGITFFEVTDNITTFKELKHNKTNNAIDKTNCN